MSAFISVREQLQELAIENLRTLVSRLCMTLEQHFPTMTGEVREIQEQLFADFTAKQIEMAKGYLNGNGPRGMALQAVYGDAAAEMHERELPVRYPQEGLGDLAALLRRCFVLYDLGSRKLSIRASQLGEGSLSVSMRTSSVFTSPEYAETSITIGNLSDPKAVGALGYTVVLPFRPADELRNRIVMLLPLGSVKPTFLVYVPLEECWVNAGETNDCYVDWTVLTADAKRLIESAGLQTDGIELGAAFEKLWPAVALLNLPAVGVSERWDVPSTVDRWGHRVGLEWCEPQFQHVRDGSVDALQLRIGFDVFTITKGVEQEGDASTIYRFSSAGDSFGLNWDSVPYQVRDRLIDVYMTTIAATAAARSESAVSELPGDADASS